MKQLLPLCLALCLLSSCASIFNKRTMLVQVSTAHPCTLLNSEVYQSVDTGNGLQFYETGQLFPINPDRPLLLKVWRSRESLPLRLAQDSIKTLVRVNSKKSWVYWLNFGTIVWYGVGFLGDIGTEKKFEYPNDIYVDLAHPENNYFGHTSLAQPEPAPAPAEFHRGESPKVIFSKDAK